VTVAGASTALWLLAAVPALAAVAALLLPGRHRPGVVALAPLAPLAAVPLALAGPAAGGIELPWLLLGTVLEVDAVGRPLLLVAALLYAAALAGSGPPVPERRDAFTGFLLAAWLGNAGLLVAADAVTFYLCFAVMSFTAWGLVVHDRTAQALRAGRVYLVLTVLGELCVLSGVLLAIAAGGRLLADAPAAVAGSAYLHVVVGLLVAGFGVKAGLVPLHLWLPLAHPAAPAPASAVLSGAMVKAGLVGMLRFLPLGEVALPGWGALVGLVSLAAAFLAVAVGLTQREAKAALAYSTVSQMGFLLVMVGVALASPQLAPGAVAGAVLYAVHHGLAKGALFLGVGVWKAYAGSRARRWVLAGLAATALAVAGAPFTSGAAAKYAAKEAVAEDTLAGVDLQLLLPLVGVGTTLLLVRFLALLPRDLPPATVRLGAPGLLAAWTGLVSAGALLSWVLAPRWLPDAALPSVTAPVLWAAAWPVVLGLALLAGGRVLVARGTLAAPAVPPGDVVVVAEAALRLAARGWRAGEAAVAGARPGLRRPAAAAAVTRADGLLGGWRASGAALAVVLLGLAVSLAVGR
jgi:hydrogenase-4 component B